MDRPKMLTVKELAAELRISTDAVYKLCAEDGLPFLRVGRRFVFDLEDVKRHLADQTKRTRDVDRERVKQPPQIQEASPNGVRLVKWKPYRRRGSKIWYGDVRDKRSGQRFRFSTRETSKKRADDYIDKWIAEREKEAAHYCPHCGGEVSVVLAKR